MLSGRDFTPADTRSTPPIVIVNEALARKFFSSPNVIGKHLRLSEGKDLGPPVEVVGVVGTTKYRSLKDSAQPIMYFPHAQQAAGSNRAFLVLRTRGEPGDVAPDLRALTAQIDPRISIQFTALERQLSESMTLTRAISTLSGVFGALALLLATIGLYGIMAYTVARRRNEIGVRIALGAGRQHVLGMVLSDATRIVVIGIVIGGALSMVATRLISTFLYAVAPKDPLTLGASALLLLVVGAAAAALPAWRASTLDPVAALRED
jgi:ABC-type antimicrobial peptide transport system permease subunit